MEEYDKITDTRLLKEQYILLYLPVNDNKKLRKKAKEYAKENGYKILEISTKLLKKNTELHKTLPAAGIEEFLSSIKNAECIFTNSLHAVCFSIIFKKILSKRLLFFSVFGRILRLTVIGCGTIAKR